jgi:ribosomal protein L31
MKPDIHPDYHQRIVDTAGQVEKLRRRYGDTRPRAA